MFRDIPLSLLNVPKGHYGAMAVGDVDNDGRNEVFIPNSTGPNLILKGITLRPAGPPVLAAEDHPTVAATFADINEDGIEELFCLADPVSQTPDRLLKHTHEGWVNLLIGVQLGRHGAGGLNCVPYDRRGGGKYGFLVTNEHRLLKLLEWGPEETLVDLAPTMNLPNTNIVHVLPRHINRPRDLILIAKDGTVTLKSSQQLTQISKTRGQVTAAEWCHGGLALTYMDEANLCLAPTPHWKDKAGPAWALPSRTSHIVSADLNNDGLDEVVFLNYGEPSRFFAPSLSNWKMQDPGPLADPGLFPTSFAVVDLDGDGVLELVIARAPHAVGAAVKVYKMAEVNAENAVRILPRTRYGAPARGVAVSANGCMRMTGNGPYEPCVNFGFAGGTIEVMWPDGTVVQREDLPTGKRWVVEYPEE